jgi:hypothetical protein
MACGAVFEQAPPRSGELPRAWGNAGPGRFRPPTHESDRAHGHRWYH